MSIDLFTLREDDSLRRARELMEREGLHHLPVLDARGVFAGLLTQRDLLAALAVALREGAASGANPEESLRVGAAMTREVTGVDEDADARQAARYLREHRVGCLPVLSQGRLVGIVTESDFLALVERLLQRGG